MIDIQYPIGKYEPKPYSEQLKMSWLNNIRQLPSQLESAIQNLDAEHLTVRIEKAVGPYSNSCTILLTVI